MFAGFVWSIATFPNLTVTFRLPVFNLLEKYSKILFTYDTAFNLRDFYNVTTFVVQLGQFWE